MTLCLDRRRADGSAAGSLVESVIAKFVRPEMPASRHLASLNSYVTSNCLTEAGASGRNTYCDTNASIYPGLRVTGNIRGH